MQDKSGGSIDIQPKPYMMISDGFTCAPLHYQPCVLPLSSSTEMDEYHHKDGAAVITC